MRKIAVGFSAFMALLALAVVLAPRVGAQARRNLPAGPDVLMLQGPGSSIGISVRDLMPEEAAKDKVQGAYVDDVRDGTPAARAGIKRGDIVVEFDGEKIRSARQLTRVVRETPPGRTVTAAVVRDGKRQTLQVSPDSQSAQGIENLPEIRREVEEAMRNIPRELDGVLPAFGAQARLGATVTSLTPQLADYFGVKNGSLVSEVTADSPAARAGLKAGDVITAINGAAVDRPSDIAASLRQVGADGGKLDLKITRDLTQMTITVQVPARDRPRASARRIPV
jgi:serine protease Do